MLFAGFRFSKRAGTNAFPYGYDRAEDMAGLAIAVVIWASAVFAGVESFHKLTHHGATRHLGAGMVGAIIGVAANRVVARYKLRAGTQIQSATLIADARHSWLDAISSAGALTGLVGVAFGAWWSDPVAGIAVTVSKASPARSPRPVGAADVSESKPSSRSIRTHRSATPPTPTPATTLNSQS